jgi:hypothetical protein
LYLTRWGCSWWAGTAASAQGLTVLVECPNRRQFAMPSVALVRADGGYRGRSPDWARLADHTRHDLPNTCLPDLAIGHRDQRRFLR